MTAFLVFLAFGFVCAGVGYASGHAAGWSEGYYTGHAKGD